MVGNPNNAIRGQAIAPLRYSRWATMFGIGGTVSGDDNASGYRQSFGGALAGVDRAIWTGTRVGGWLSLATGNVATKDRWVDENTNVTNVMVGMYLRQEMYYGYGLLAAGFGVDEYKTKRNLWLLGHKAESKFNGTIGTAYLERGIDIPIYYATVQPYTSFQVVGVSQDKFKETMWNQLGDRGEYSDVGLEGLKGSTDSYKMALGARASSMPVPFRWGQVALTTNAAWFHEFNKNNRGFTARFANPGGVNYDTKLDTETYTITGTNPKQDWLNFGFGLNMDRNSTRLFLNADLFANDRQTLFSGGGGFITSW
jgi:outer membrane autotransporter protein